MAWRRLAVALRNAEPGFFLTPDRALEAATRAYELRDRLGPRERYLAAAFYHDRVTGDSDAMIAAYESVLELDPDDVHALNNLGLAYRLSQDWDAAAPVLERAARHPRAGIQVFSNLYVARIGQGRLEGAEAVADTVARRFPRQEGLTGMYFWARLLRGDTAGARSVVEPILADASSPPARRAAAHGYLSALALQRGRVAEARRHLEAAERIERGSRPHGWMTRRLLRAHLEVLVGDPDRAVRLLRDAERELPEDAAAQDRYHFARAIVLAMAGAVDEAELVMGRFEKEVEPELHEQFRVQNESARAVIRLQRGDPDGAVRILQWIRTTQPCRACYADRMGWALLEAGRLREAAEEWEVAVAWKDLTHYTQWQLGQHLWTLERLPALYESLGDTARALVHYRRIVELWEDADPELQPRVNHALARIAASEGGP